MYENLLNEIWLCIWVPLTWHFRRTSYHGKFHYKGEIKTERKEIKVGVNSEYESASEKKKLIDKETQNHLLITVGLDNDRHYSEK